MAQAVLLYTDIRRLTELEKSNYTLLRDSYFGSGGFADGANIIKFPRESEKSYDRRKTMKLFEPLCSTLLDARVKPIFANVLREGGDAKWELFTKDATGEGEELTQYMWEMATLGTLYGGMAVVMDAPSSIPDSLQAVLDTRAIPYLFYIVPDQFEYYRFDRRGRLDILVIQDHKDAAGVLWYRVWDKNDATPITYLTSDLSKVPADIAPVRTMPTWVAFQPRIDKQSLPVSKWQGIAEATKTVYNQNSLIATQEAESSFNILTVNGSKKGELEKGVDSTLYYAQGSNKPEYIAPDSSTIEVIGKRKAEVIRQAYEATYNGLLLANANVSGESKAWSDLYRQQEIQWVLTRIMQVEDWTRNAWESYVSKTDSSVKYVPAMGSGTLGSDVEVAQKLITTGIEAQNAAEVRGDLLRKYFDGRTPEDIDAIVAREIAYGEEMATYETPDQNQDQNGDQNNDSNGDDQNNDGRPIPPKAPNADGAA